MEHDNILVYDGVTYRRDGRIILKGVDFTMRKGENWALLGLNGSGKSTMLGMIPAYTYPSTGSVQVFGHTFGKYIWEKVKKRVGFVSSTINEFLTTLNYEKTQDIILSGKFNSIGIYEELNPEDRKLGGELLKEFGLEYIKDSRFHTLSQGEQRRTLIARGFMNKPDLLVLDEPCSGLDLKSREHLLKTLEKKYENENTPLIYVTHNIDEIIPSISHVAIMEEGLIRYSGKKEDILTKEILSHVYDCDVEINWVDKRPWIRVNWNVE